MENKKEKTAPDVSVGADTEQPLFKNTTSSISKYQGNIKSFEEMQREMQLSLDSSYLKTISMNELFDTQYGSKQPLIDGLLYPGTYIFAGSPKLGKSFLMAQLAYHVSTGIGIPEMKYFNLDSDELLDEKIEVLTQIKEGKTIAEIPNFYKVLEDLPEDDMWD